MLVLDFTSAFNTVVPHKLDKLLRLNVHLTVCYWILDFLLERLKVVRINNGNPSPRVLNTDAPQSCVLSLPFVHLSTNNCVSLDPSVLVTKLSDDTTLIGLILDGDEGVYRTEAECLAGWCSDNNLVPYVSKTKELMIDFHKAKSPTLCLMINGADVDPVDSFKFLGFSSLMICHGLLTARLLSRDATCTSTV